MKWKNKTAVEMSGISLSSSVRELAMAINHNAEVLKEAVQNIEELSKKIERMEEGKING